MKKDEYFFEYPDFNNVNLVTVVFALIKAKPRVNGTSVVTDIYSAK